MVASRRTRISAKLAELLLGSGDHAGNLGPLVGQRRHDVTFGHIHPRSQNDRADYLLQADMMSAMRLVCMRHDTAINLRRATPLSITGAVSKQEYDTRRSVQEQSVARQHYAEATLQKAFQMLRLQQVAVATAHAARLYAEWRLSQTDVTAPVDGQITNLTLARGDYVSPSGAALAIVDANAWRVMANYKEYYLRHLPPGRQVWVWLDSNPWHLYRARVQGTAHAISRDQGASTLVPYVSPTVDWIRLNRRIPVRLQLIDPPPPQNLFMGADARVFALY